MFILHFKYYLKKKKISSEKWMRNWDLALLWFAAECHDLLGTCCSGIISWRAVRIWSSGGLADPHWGLATAVLKPARAHWGLTSSVQMILICQQRHWYQQRKAPVPALLARHVRFAITLPAPTFPCSPQTITYFHSLPCPCLPLQFLRWQIPWNP